MVSGRGCLGPGQSDGRRRERQLRVGSLHQTLASSENHRDLPVSGSISERKIRQDHFQQCPLHRGTQESQRSIGDAQPAVAIVSYALARGDGDILKGDGLSIWLHAMGSSSDQSGRSTYFESPVRRGRMCAMSSVQDIIMLRSEVVWFPRFILVCRQVLNWMNPEETDYEPMK